MGCEMIRSINTRLSGGEKVIPRQNDAVGAGTRNQGVRTIERNISACAASVFAVCPAVHPRDIDVENFCNGFVTAAFGYNSERVVFHA